MNDPAIKSAIKEILANTSTCINDAGCISLLLNIRRYFFTLSPDIHLAFIDIAGEDFGIFLMMTPADRPFISAVTRMISAR
jgi:hypothetical protein